MKEIIYFDRKKQSQEKEKVYGEFLLQLLYGEGIVRQWCAFFILPLLTHLPFFSRFYGFLQKRPTSKKKVLPFIRKFAVDEKEFLEPASSFQSFNDFFVRHLNLKFRPFEDAPDVAILPADARYLVIPRLDRAERFFVKGQKLCLERLLQNPSLAERYREGAMVIARLCPVDYHRFHFPCDGVPSIARPIKGPLFSVNPIALSRRLHILSENKRVITEFKTEAFGEILYIEVGATCVGSIHQTHEAGKFQKKGEEKGYFSFGGSCLILLFEPRRICFDEDLIHYSAQGIEVRGLLGQSLGKVL